MRPLLLLVFVLVPATVGAQTDPRFAASMAALDAGRHAEAADSLGSLLAYQPAYADLNLGSAAYWLGEALHRAGRADSARVVRREGMRALQAGGGFDVRLADARLSDLLSVPDALDGGMDEAVDLYVNLLYNADAALNEDERDVLGRHLAELALVVPDAVMQDAVRGDPAEGAWEARSGAGPLLVAWWRSEDPIPATRENERVKEHLRRIAEARRRFSGRDGLLDDRGAVYLRYGEPERAIEITFDDPVLIDIVYRPGVAVSLGDFPANAFWVYGHIDRAAWFLFVESRGAFRLGDTHDLLPDNLRSGFAAGARGRIKAGMTIAVLQNVFRQLAPLHSDFAMRYAEVDAYAMSMPEFATGRMSARSSSPLSARPAPPRGSGQTDDPGRFVETVLVRSRTEDDASIARRETSVPPVVSAALAGTTPLDVGYRTIRYLEPDGSTRTVVHWAPAPGALRPDRDGRALLENAGITDFSRFLLSVTTVQKNAAYEDRVIRSDRVLVTDLPVDDGVIPVRQTTLQGDTTLYHVALQWDQYGVLGRGAAGPLVRMTTARVDSLLPLSADPRVLEMSDPLPMVGLRNVAPADLKPSPYPFTVLTREQQLALAFDVYHLAFGADDLTRYSVSFEVRRREGRGGLLQRRSDRATSTRFSGTGSSRTAREMIFVDLQDWQGSGELEVRIEVTDETDGRRVERSVWFELRD